MSKQKHGKRYSEEQIIRILDEVRGGRAVSEVARSYGFQRTQSIVGRADSEK